MRHLWGYRGLGEGPYGAIGIPLRAIGLSRGILGGLQAFLQGFCGHPYGALKALWGTYRAI